MRKFKFIMPVLIAAGTLVTIVAISAFKNGHNGKNKYLLNAKSPADHFTTYYFRFNGSNVEADYEDSTKWATLTGLPPSDPCPNDDIFVCVLHTTDIANGTRTALTDYLKTQPSAKDYCNTASRVDYKRE